MTNKIKFLVSLCENLELPNIDKILNLFCSVNTSGHISKIISIKIPFDSFLLLLLFKCLKLSGLKLSGSCFIGLFCSKESASI